MGEIENTVQIFERIKKYGYQFVVSDSNTQTIFDLWFEDKHFHHLIGLQHLTDKTNLSDPVISKTRFYRLLQNKRITEEDICRSVHYDEIEERICSFSRLEELLTSGRCEVIVRYDKNKAQSEIEAVYLVFKREGNPLAGENVTYYSLFIGYDTVEDRYYPATYLVEHSRKYVVNQTFLDCEIKLVAP